MTSRDLNNLIANFRFEVRSQGTLAGDWPPWSTWGRRSLLGPQGANKLSVNEATQDVFANMMSTYRDNSISRLTAYWVEIKTGLKVYTLYIEFASVNGEQVLPCCS
jgi:hypothetical protein